MSQYVPEMIKDFFKSTAKNPLAVAPRHLYAYKTRFALLGTVGSGKSTIASLMVLTSQTLSSDREGKFLCRVIESTSGILGDVSRLRIGKFPDKTNPYLAYATEAGLLIHWKSMFGGKNIQVPICDIAGEDIQAMIQRYNQGNVKLGQAQYSAAMQLVNYVKDADGFILTVPASKAWFSRSGQFERESGSEEGKIHFDPDVNLYRILNEVYEHKQRVKKPIKGIAVVITKWDLIRDAAENEGMNVYTSEGLKEFMDVCFPATSQILRFYGMENVRFFTSYLELEKDQDGNPKTWDNNPSSHDYKILVKDRRQPSYDVQSSIDMIDYLKTFAT